MSKQTKWIIVGVVIGALCIWYFEPFAGLAEQGGLPPATGQAAGTQIGGQGGRDRLPDNKSRAAALMEAMAKLDTGATLLRT